MTENDTPTNDAVEDKSPEAENQEAAARVETPPATEEGTEPAAEEKPIPSETAEGEEPPIAYTVKEIKDEEGSVKRYCVEVEAEILDAKMADILDNLRKTVVIDGFRIGKAPIRLLKSRFGKDAEKDALNEIAGKLTDQIVEKDKLEVVGEPSLHDSKVEEGKPVALEIDIEVQPTLDIEGYKDGEYEVEVANVTDEIVESEIEKIRQANATYEIPKDEAKPYAKGDGVTLDIEVVGPDGKRMEPLCQKDVFMRDPSMEMMPSVVEALEGKKIGETFTASVERKAPGAKGDKETLTDAYTVTVKEIKERQVPELDDDFAKDLGEFETLEDLRKRIRDDLEQQAEARKRQGAMSKIFDRLIEKNEFQAPKSVVAAQEYQTIMRDTQQMQAMGMDLSAMGMSTGDYLQSARVNAERFVKINLMVNAVAEKEKLEASDEDVNKRIEEMAEREGRKPLAIRARLEKEKRLDSLKRELLVDTVESYLMEQNAIKVVEPKPAEVEKPAKAEKDAKADKKDAKAKK